MGNLQDLPPELIAMITADLEFGSRMSLMLASKLLFSKVPKVRATRRQAWIDFNLNFERHVPRFRPLPLLTCTQCAKLHPRAKFSDAQGKKICPKRFCIRTGIQKKKYRWATRTFRVRGVDMFGCAGCFKACRESKEVLYPGRKELLENTRWCKGCKPRAEAYVRSKSKGSRCENPFR